MNSRMCRRRGSAIALKGSDLVEARGMGQLYIPIWEYVKRHVARPATPGLARAFVCRDNASGHGRGGSSVRSMDHLDRGTDAEFRAPKRLDAAPTEELGRTCHRGLCEDDDVRGAGDAG